MELLIIGAHILSVALGFFVTMELVYNIRKVIVTGTVFPRAGCFMIVSWGLMLLVGVFLYNTGDLASGCLAFSVAAIPGLIMGLKADPFQ